VTRVEGPKRYWEGEEKGKIKNSAEAAQYQNWVRQGGWKSRGGKKKGWMDLKKTKGVFESQEGKKGRENKRFRKDPYTLTPCRIILG